MDRSLGRFLTRIQQWGLFDDALFVFTSDHGETFQEHREWTHGAGLYQHQVHVPLLFRSPRRRDLEGRRISDVVRSIDIMPTILAELDLPRPDTLQGVSLFDRSRRAGDLLARGALIEDHREKKNQSGLREVALRIGRYKVVLRTPQRGAPALTVFDLERDPAEQQGEWQGSLDDLPPDVSAAIDLLHAWAWDAGMEFPEPETNAAVIVTDIEDLKDLGYIGADLPQDD